MEVNAKQQLVLVKTFNNSFDANLAKRKLDERGISVFLEDENVVGLNPLGGVELKVFEKDLKLAQKILSEK